MASTKRHSDSFLGRKGSLLVSRLRSSLSNAKPTTGWLVHRKSVDASSDRSSSDDRRLSFRMSCSTTVHESSPDEAYHAFLHEFPEYKLTFILDELRRSDYSRLDRTGETYVDYMGGSLYPDSLVRAYTDFLNQNVLGNTHSISNSSKLSLQYANEARAAVLRHFNAPKGYAVIFTANATGALKLIGEAYPFSANSSYVLGSDSHNSLHGIREYAMGKGATVQYIPATPTGGFDLSNAQEVLSRYKPQSAVAGSSLFALTGLSNISNCKNPLSIAQYAASLGYHTLLDAAALAPTSTISLTEHPVDAMAISFYKMFGFPTGVGALVVKESFLAKLKRPWFAGGTVDLVQVPGTIMTRARELHEQFEDGTINYLSLPSITNGLRFLSVYLPFLPLRLSCLLQYLISTISTLRHDATKTPVIRILSRTPELRMEAPGDQSDTGATLSLLFLGPDGEPLPNSFIEYAASKQNISLRTGCVCNPGGALALLKLEDDIGHLQIGDTRHDLEKHLARELGVVRISLGLASNFQDVWRVVNFARDISRKESRQALWNQWMRSSSSCKRP